ncbi:MAG: hypothetical protein HQL35_09045 [Alphaproteobacteria bacterium]|nr:hypothetical protein [Alphaproteobacteria bacterium]
MQAFDIVIIGTDMAGVATAREIRKRNADLAIALAEAAGLTVVVCPPRPGAEGAWTVGGEGPDRRAVFAAPGGQVLGFALTGAETKARQAMAKAMADVLAV